MKIFSFGFERAHPANPSKRKISALLVWTGFPLAIIMNIPRYYVPFFYILGAMAPPVPLFPRDGSVKKNKTMAVLFRQTLKKNPSWPFLALHCIGAIDITRLDKRPQWPCLLGWRVSSFLPGSLHHDHHYNPNNCDNCDNSSWSSALPGCHCVGSNALGPCHKWRPSPLEA